MAAVPRFVLATANPHKVDEIAAILEGLAELLPRPDSVQEVEENAPTLVGNARLKAVAIATATGDAALADDTGLEIDALDGEPGVRSARFAGEPPRDSANRALVLERLQGLGESARSARFRTVIVTVDPDGSERVCEGVVEGHIIDSERGEGGFGYDSIFVPNDGDGRTFAEMSGEEKNEISHRGRALRALAKVLAEEQTNA
jgi:XTP/dITP diphosphohydrolase